MPSSLTPVDRDVPIAINSTGNARWPQRAIALLLLSQKQAEQVAMAFAIISSREGDLP
jgi:hypothetical protein